MAMYSCICSFVSRYKQEFGFTLTGRPIIVDDIRVRGVGKSQVDMDNPIPESGGKPPRIETVSCFTTIAYHILFVPQQRLTF